MGLGPPVCRDCKMHMQYNGTYPYWTCPKCNKNAHTDEGVGHLFCMKDEEIAEYDRNSGTNFLKLLKEPPSESPSTDPNPNQPENERVDSNSQDPHRGNLGSLPQG